jgi:hypothetical protein
MRAVNTALGVVQKGNAGLVALSLIAVSPGKRSQGVRLELIQQSQDFLETVKYRAERFAIPVERHEMYTENTLESLETLPRELGCEGMILFSRGEQALLLSNQEVRHMLSRVPLSLMLIDLGQTEPSWFSHKVAGFSSWLQGLWKDNTAIVLDQKKSA